MPRGTPSWIASAAARLTRIRRAAFSPGPPVTGHWTGAAPATPPRPRQVTEPPARKVTLRAERSGSDYRHLGAFVDGTGRLHIDGQDLGPGTSIVSDDGEYEWFETIAAADIPRLVALLGGDAGEDILDLLERDYTGPGSYELEKRLRESDIPVQRHVW